MELNSNNKYLLGVESTKVRYLNDVKDHYEHSIVISEDVYQWLKIHDIEINEFGKRVYICNNVRYVDLGPYINLKNEK